MTTFHGTNNGDFADALDVFVLDYTDNNVLTNDKVKVSDSTGDEFHSYEGDDVVRAGWGDDIIHGHHGNDTLYAEGGDDELNGGDNDDTLFGGAGGDELNGGSGIDEILYMGSSSGVTVNLLTGTGSGGHAAGDTISGVENLSGSGFDDTLTGTDGANNIEGGYADDVIEGLDGVDELYGNYGSDTLIGGGENDYLCGDYISRAPASPFFVIPAYYSDKTSAPDTFDDILRGGLGNDTLDGGQGADELDGGGGEDTITYDGSSAIYVSLEDEVALGGADGDTFISIENVTGSSGTDTIEGATARRMNSRALTATTPSRAWEATTRSSAAMARICFRAAAAATISTAATRTTGSMPMMSRRRISSSRWTATTFSARPAMTSCTAGTATTGWKAARAPTNSMAAAARIWLTTTLPTPGWSSPCSPEQPPAAMLPATRSTPSRTSEARTTTTRSTATTRRTSSTAWATTTL